MQETPTTKHEDNPATEVSSKKESPQEGSWFDFLRFALLAVVIVVPIRYFIAQPFIVSGRSMIPTYQDGNYLIIDEIGYRFTKPSRGDAIVFRLPRNPETFLIKRIAGLPNETILIENDQVTIINKENPDGYIWEQGTIAATGKEAHHTMTLGDDEYFVLGDNRNESADSRQWGRLNEKYITGRPILRLFPLNKMSFFPGRWTE